VLDTRKPCRLIVGETGRSVIRINDAYRRRQAFADQTQLHLNIAGRIRSGIGLSIGPLISRPATRISPAG